MDIREQLRAYQGESIAKRKAELEQQQKEYEDYLQSEQYQRDLWEHQQDLWKKKAKKEGWTYTRRPFISAADRQRMEQQTKEQEIAYLEEKLKTLKGEQE